MDGSKSSIISIHALLAESDGVTVLGIQHRVGISIHALLAESDYVLVNTFLEIFEFLSTLSLRRATSIKPIFGKIDTNFYPRSPCGERPDIRPPNLSSISISIHALLAESDEPTSVRNDKNNIFLSTLSLRRATPALHDILELLAFLSTLSLRRATPLFGHCFSDARFLSTLSLRRATVNGGGLLSCFGNFYPRSPCGERRARSASKLGGMSISIHALLAESDSLTERRH